MSKKEVFVFALLAIGIACAFGGIALVTRGASQGWIGIVVAVPLLLLAQRSMRVVRATIDATEVVDVVDTKRKASLPSSAAPTSLP